MGEPFVVYGTNPIVAYVLSSLVAKALLVWRSRWLTEPRCTSSPTSTSTCLRRSAPVNASLYYAFAYTLLWLGVTALLYRRQIFIKI